MICVTEHAEVFKKLFNVHISTCTFLYANPRAQILTYKPQGLSSNHDPRTQWLHRTQ